MFSYQINDDLSLKLLEAKDSKELFTLVDESRSYLRKWLPWVDNIKGAADYEHIIQVWLKQYASQDGFQAGILYQGKLVGMIGFHSIDWSNSRTSLGYWLAESYQGNGMITSAVKAFIKIAFTEYKLNRIEIECAVKNEKSRHIPERLGFKQEGIKRDGECLDGDFHDMVLYSLLSREWEAK